MAKTHVAIVGGGSAAFAAAVRAAEGGASVTLVQAGPLGGTCVNVGCVPSKIMIRAAEIAHLQAHHPVRGLARVTPAIDRAAMLDQQQRRAADLRRLKYARVIENEPRIRLLSGRARFVDGHTLEVVDDADGVSTTVTAGRILIATGRAPNVAAVPGLVGTPFWSSADALTAEGLPRHLLVYGGSVVAVELAQAFLRLGSRVTLLARSTLLSREDPALGTGLQAALTAEGMRVVTHAQITGVRHDGADFHADIGRESLVGDRLLIATGRRPNTASLGLEQIGVRTAADGAVIVDERLRTSAANVYAAGDCAALPQYVYVAAAAGRTAAANMLGGDEVIDLSLVPAVTFTDPQVATVGLGEDAARAKGYRVDTRTLPLDDIPRALVNFQSTGFVKLVAERYSGALLGAHILAPQAGEMIQTAALAIRHRMTVRDLADQLFPYLTMVEGLKLCALSFFRNVRELPCCAG